MTTEKATSNWSAIRKHINGWAKPELMALVKDLYEASPGNRDFLHARFPAEHDSAAALETYRRKIIDQFFPQRGFGKLKLSEARKAIRDYRKASGDIPGTIDLMLTYLENGTDFAREFGGMDDRFVDSLVSVLKEMTDLLWHEDGDIYPRFRERLSSLEKRANEIGWGWGDCVSEKVGFLESELANDEDEPKPIAEPAPRPESAPSQIIQMTTPAKLTDLIEALEFDSEEHYSYYDRQTGRVVVVEDTIMDAVEEGRKQTLEDVPEWQKEEIETAQAIANDGTGRFIAPPDKFDFDEYRLMEKFVGTVADKEVSDELLRAIKGRGAFRRFKDVLYRLGMQDQWFRYRDEAMKEFVVEWAKAKNVPYKDDLLERRK
jgi:hypothetical protein